MKPEQQRKATSFSLPQLFVVFIFTLALPLIFSAASFEFFLSKYNDFAHAIALAENINKLESFNNALIPTNFLMGSKEKLRQVTPAEIGSADITPEGIRDYLEAKIGVKTMVCVLYSKDLRSVKLTQRVIPGLEDVVFPRAALFRRPLNTICNIKPPENSGEAEFFDRSQQRLALEIQQRFRTITPVNINFHKVAQNFSAYYDGDLYFMIENFSEPIGDFAGAFIVIHGSSITPEMLVTNARIAAPECNVSFHPLNSVEFLAKPTAFISSFADDRDEDVISAPANDYFVRQCLQRGRTTISSKPPLKYPFVEMKVTMTETRQKLNRLRNVLRKSSFFIILLAAIAFLRAYLLGISFSPAFRTKVLAATLFAALFPFVSFSLSFYLYQQYDEHISSINLEQHMHTRLLQIHMELSDYVSELESKSFEIGNSIFSNVVSVDKPSLEIILNRIGEMLPISKVTYYDKKDFYPISFPERLTTLRGADVQESIENFYPPIAIKALSSDVAEDRSAQYIIDIAWHEIQASSINSALTSNGAFFLMSLEGVPSFLASLPIYANEGANRIPKAFVLFKYEPGPILDTFFTSRTQIADNFEETFGDYRIKYAFLPTERTGASYIWNGAGHEKLIHYPTPFSRPEVQYNSQQKVVERNNSYIPHTAIAVAEKITSNSQTEMAITPVLASLIYLLIVFWFSDLLLRKVFVFPVKDLAANAEKVARGADQWQIPARTGDEFEVINKSFSEMVTGLAQRNMMRDYVSSDALSEIENSETKDLAPGGDFRNVTVLFASIKDFRSHQTNFSPHEIINLLNKFITVADNFAREHQGNIDKIIENTIMMVFRSTSETEVSHAINAVKAAMAINSQLESDGLKGVIAGIASGNVISGRIGSYKGKLDYTVIGDTVNLAARLKSEATESNSGIIVSGSTMRLLKGKARVSFLRRCRLKGKAREYNIYELTGLR